MFEMNSNCIHTISMNTITIRYTFLLLSYFENIKGGNSYCLTLHARACLCVCVYVTVVPLTGELS